MTRTNTVARPDLIPQQYVYFARGSRSGLIKIGFSNNPTKRMGQLSGAETVSILFTVHGGREKEVHYHDRFRKCWEHGEWFREEGELQRYLRSRGVGSIKHVPQTVKAVPVKLVMVPRNFGYARVSTESQVLDVQLIALKKAGCDRIFQETISAVNAKRPEFNLMMKHVERGDTITVYAFSRLNRDLEKLLAFVREMKALGVKIVSTSEPTIDPLTANGKMMLSMVGAMDEHERNRVIERTKDAMQEKLRQGMYLGRPRLIAVKDLPKMRAMRKRGVPACKIAKKFGIAISTVYANT